MVKLQTKTSIARPLRLIGIIIVIVFSVIAFAYMAFYFLSKQNLSRKVAVSTEPAIQDAALSIQKIAAPTRQDPIVTDCGYNPKSHITDCFTSLKYVSEESKGDVLSLLKSFDKAMTSEGWDSRSNELFFEDFNKIFVEPLNYRDYRGLVSQGALHYSRNINNVDVSAYVTISSTPQEASSQPLGAQNTDARKAIENGRYYLQIYLLVNKSFAGNKF